jgi:D-serine deaminase-like pyridoxal phosphate-dependent protein
MLRYSCRKEEQYHALFTSGSAVVGRGRVRHRRKRVGVAAVGDVVRIVPNHVCVVVNMMDEVVMVRGDEIVGTLPVAARGKLR